jgi:trimethylamine--corrinoid protein Co-methyltransferase
MGFDLNIEKYEILSKEDIDRINDISFKILEEIGIKINHAGLLDRLKNEGIDVDLKSSKVKFSRELVLDSIEKSNKKHILYGRNRTNKAEFGYNKFNFNGSSGQHLILDQKTKKTRRPKLSDLKDSIIIGESLENINIVGAMVVPSDIPQDSVDIITAYELLAGTSKPFSSWIFSGESARIIIEMMQIVAGGKEELKKYPPYEVFIEPISPLTYRKNSIEIMLEFIDAGLPIGFSPMVQMGASGPFSFSGVLALENAEILSGITMTQILNPGHPVTYGGIAHIFDMKNQTISFGSPEQALISIALTNLGKYFDFPVYSNTGLTDSKNIDTQSGFETAATLLAGSMAGSDIFGHLGISGADYAADLTKLIIDNEFAGYIIRILSGFNIKDLEDSYKEILNIGISGNFLSSDMTLNNFRKIIWYPELFQRRTQDTGDRIINKALEKKDSLLKKGRLLPLDKKTDNELRRIIKLNKHNLPSDL